MNWFTPRHYDELATSLTHLTLAIAGLNHKVDTIMADLTKLTASIAALNTAVTSAVTDLGALSADIAALKAATSDPTTQAAIDALQTQVDSITGTLSTATAANPA